MLEFFKKLFDTSDFPARWHCGNWTTGHGSLHIVSDIVVFSCYLAIPFLLMWFKRQRKDIPFPRVFTLFSVFILSCGVVHLVEAVIFYQPLYRVSGVTKAVTAMASLATVGYLVPAMPRFFALRSPKELEGEIEQRVCVEAELKKLQHGLERQVEERSRELIEERERLRVALRQLKESEALLSAALNSAPNAMAMVDADGGIKLHNNEFARLFGYSETELSDLKVEQLLPPERRASHASHRKNFLASPIRRPMGADQLLHGLHRSGQSIPLEIGLNPVEVHGESFTIVAIVDISERVKTLEALAMREASLRRSNEELKEFVYAASHDLQEPLRKVTAFCQLLEREAGDKLDERSLNYVHFAVDGAQRMQRLIKDLLDYSRVAQGRHELVAIDTKEVVSDVLNELSVAIEETKATINVGSLPGVRSQRFLLDQIFSNLISNALKYHHPDRLPVVDISAEMKSKSVVFSVTDNGIGIPQEHRERVFRVFQRLHRKEEYAGTGIGLAVVKKAVERCGGEVWIEDSPHAGVTVAFSIPLVS